MRWSRFIAHHGAARAPRPARSARPRPRRTSARTRALAVALAPVALFAAAAAAPDARAADRILQRLRPLSVRWGEVEVSETALVKVAMNDGETTYPNALALVFKARLRQEDVQGLLEGTSRARAQTTVAGTLHVAARMSGGRGDWDGFARRLQEAAGRLTPAGYEAFVGNVTGSLTAAADPGSGEYLITYCIVVPGSPDRSGEVHRSLVKDGKGGAATTGASVYGKGGSSCAPLRDAFAGRPPVDVLSTGFNVDESLEESLDLAAQSRLQQPPVPFPEGTQISRTGPPPGATGFSKVTKQDGAAHGEMLRRDGAGGSSAGAGDPYIYTVDLKDAALARDLPRGRSLLARWDVARRDTRLGTAPRALSEERQSLLMGVFCTTMTCAPDLEALKSTTLARLDVMEGLLGADLVRKALDIQGLPPDSFTVLCDPGSGREMNATWCLSNACAKVLNPDEVCGDIAGALPE
jgi:hypothetical protein